MTPGFFITETAAHLINRPAARSQQTFHVIFRAGHQIQRHAVSRTRPDKTRLKRHQMNVGHRGLAHCWRFNFQYAAIGKETSNLSEDSRTLQQIGDGSTGLPACCFAHGDLLRIQKSHAVYLHPRRQTNISFYEAQCRESLNLHSHQITMTTPLV
ncbi:hypothetical protein SRABI106_04510 [Rahnella aquatilis]|nr:hypothetical protein SRABI106_04510 [Rahnella aquatilis]